ncbi:MAG: hypothetical protein P4L83_17100, partial [Nevskia sp.]|nr:hypothetical protein [Nevskia sp.]
MMRWKLVAGAAVVLCLSACGSGNYNGGSGATAQNAPAVGGGSSSGSVSGSSSGTGSSGGSCTVATSHARPVALVAPGSDSATQAYFNANVEPNVQSGNCRVCHAAGGLANQPGYPITNHLTLSSDTTQDYANFVAAWQNLPQPANVTQND